VELWMIRHGLPIRIDGGDAPADPGLAPEGIDQAERLARAWAPHGADAVYSSPLARALETAAPLARDLGVEVQTDDGLVEFDAHLSFYVPIEELRADEERWKQVVEEWMSPEAEAGRQEFRETVVTAVDAIAARHPGQRVAVVCHGGVINAYLSRLLAMTGTIFFEPAYTSVSRVLAGSTHKQVVSINETGHLADLPIPATAPSDDLVDDEDPAV
jgi:probable phosphoglycerate mutase